MISIHTLTIYVFDILQIKIQMKSIGYSDFMSCSLTDARKRIRTNCMNLNILLRQHNILYIICLYVSVFCSLLDMEFIVVVYTWSFLHILINDEKIIYFSIFPCMCIYTYCMIKIFYGLFFVVVIPNIL